MKQRFNGQRNATPCGSTDNRKRNKTANPLHPFKNGAGKLLLTLCLLLTSVSAWAADYLIKSGNYYIGMNAAGNALQAYTTPDASCVWTCLNGTTETTLSTTSRSMRNKKNTRYYLTATVTRGGNALNQ